MQALNRLLFEERDARDLAAMRITLGLLLVVWWAMLWPDLGQLFTEAGPVDVRLLEESWSRFRFGPFDGFSEGQLQAVHVLGFGVVLAYLVGWKTRVMNVLVVFLLAAYWHRSPWAVNGGDRLLRIFAFYMCFAPSGRMWSLDAWLAGTRSATAPVFAIRLIQLQAIVMYTYTGIAKMSGHTWHQGTALYYSLADVGYARFPAITDQLLSYTWFRAFLMPSTWIALVWELFFGPLVIYKKTRNATLIIGLVVHAGIFAGLVVGIFSWISVWSYLAFLPAGWAGRLAERVVGAPDGPVPADADGTPALEPSEDPA